MKYITNRLCLKKRKNIKILKYKFLKINQFMHYLNFDFNVLKILKHIFIQHLFTKNK